MAETTDHVQSESAQMKALSIRQPWAWLIVQGVKPIENRSWATKFRGQFLIHASKSCTHKEYQDAYKFYQTVGLAPNLPSHRQLARGGIVGVANLVDCVSASDSPWFTGQYGFILQKIKPLSMIPCKGQLGFFNVSDLVVQEACDQGVIAKTKGARKT